MEPIDTSKSHFLFRFKFLIFSLACLGGLLFFARSYSSKSSSQKLLVYAYSSFTASWGPGPALKKIFEEQCHCEIELRDADDSRLLLQRLEMEGTRVNADVAVGFNQWDVDEAVDNLDFRTFESIGEIPLPGGINLKDDKQKKLVVFDWGILAFNTKISRDVAKARNFTAFLEGLPNKSLALQDPRTSAPGLSFLLWLVQVKGEEEAFKYLQALSAKIFTVASGWSSSYGLFQKDQAQAVFSYVTSPLYHQIEEKDLNYLALPFEEGLPLHLEYAGVLSTCSNCERAQQFVRFLLTPEAQKILMQKNYMLPVDMKVAAGTPWDLTKNFKILPPANFTKVDRQRILERWTKWVRER